MTILEWTPDLEIGIYEIDLQHRSLIGIANQLHDAIVSGKAERTIEWILEELVLYTKFHFDTEARYMRRYQPDCATQHSHEHGEMLKAVRRFKRKLKAGDESVPLAVHDFLQGWLRMHLKGTDRQLGDELREKMYGEAS
jgi:hemerythrin